MRLTAHDDKVSYDISFPYDIQGTVCTSSHCKLFTHCLSHAIVHRLERMSKENSELRLLLEKEGLNESEPTVENRISTKSKDDSQGVSCCLVPCFECVFLLKVHVFLVFLYPDSIDVIFHSPYYVHSQEVSCCLVPCFKHVFLFKVHVFLLFLYPLT